MVVADDLVSAKCHSMDTKLGGLVDCCNMSGDALPWDLPRGAQSGSTAQSMFPACRTPHLLICEQLQGSGAETAQAYAAVVLQRTETKGRGGLIG